MRRFGTLVVMVVWVAGVIIGCQGTAPTPTAAKSSAASEAKPTAAVPLPAGTAAPAATGAVQQARKPTGTMVVAIPSLFDQNWLNHTGAAARVTYQNLVYDYLLYLSPDYKLQPGLAERWEVAKDAKSWHFWLRKGVQFHKGYGELTAEDVKKTIELQSVKDSKLSRAPDYQRKVKQIDVVNPYELIVQFSEPWTDFGPEMSPYSPAGIVSKKYIDKVGLAEADKNPIGSGRYQFVEQKLGEYIKVEAVAEHWSGLPDFQTVIVKPVPEEATRVAMLKTGEADFAPISTASIEDVKKAGLKVLSVPYSYGAMIAMGGMLDKDKVPNGYDATTPWNDRRVREALSLAINRDEMAKELFKGQAVASPIVTRWPGWQDLKVPAFDVEKAKKLLADAGFPKGFDVTMRTFATAPGAELPLVAEAVAMYWQKIGVNVKIVPIDWATHRADWVAGPKVKNIMWSYRIAAVLDPETFPGRMDYYPGGTLPLYHSPTVTKLLDDLAPTVDSEKRFDLEKQIGKDLYDNISEIPLVYVNEPYGASKKIDSWATIPNWPVYLERITAAR